MSKANKDMTDREFAYTYACKRMMNECVLMQDQVDTAKLAATQRKSLGAMVRVEVELEALRQAILDALKTL